ncbi:hypothetical protein LSH36_596g01074 [Paralvinella palmiformis]|uniref:guanylate cyclase n=1 Tax=Paralvinella palmiformis TaxID=53620 RepID=A0AAD9J536_9ANNE|nr:hypothetical protein LSH36_596g01074 [Paralvinella palmiformis]
MGHQLPHTDAPIRPNIEERGNHIILTGEFLPKKLTHVLEIRKRVVQTPSTGLHHRPAIRPVPSRPTMYGLIIEAMCQIIRTKFGDNTLAEIRDKAGLHQPAFTTHRVYSESVIGRLTQAAQEVTHTPLNELMTLFGESFVPFVDQYGYARILKVLGRNMRDFLNGLDNLHEYLRFTYPKMKPPSFFCEAETKNGLTLHYRSRRKGFLYYVLGQIRAVGEQYYNIDVKIDIIKKEETLDMTHVIMNLHFDNRAFGEDGAVGDERSDKLNNFELRSDIFFEVFPFHIVFSRGLIVQNAGAGLLAVMPDIKGESIDEVFMLIRPLVDFSIENILMYSNNVFELTSVDALRNVGIQGDSHLSVDEKESICDSKKCVYGTMGCNSDSKDLDIDHMWPYVLYK